MLPRARRCTSGQRRSPTDARLGGRVPAYSVLLPGQERRVVVRHSHHGGLLGAAAGRPVPSADPRALRVAGVAPAGRTGRAHAAGGGDRGVSVRAHPPAQRRGLARASRRDLGKALRDQPDADVRRGWLDSIAALIRALTNVGAWHPDLNVGNVLLVESGPRPGTRTCSTSTGCSSSPPSDPTVRDANLDRWNGRSGNSRARFGVGFDDAEMRHLRELASAPALARDPDGTSWTASASS